MSVYAWAAIIGLALMVVALIICRWLLLIFSEIVDGEDFDAVSDDLDPGELTDAERRDLQEALDDVKREMWPAEDDDDGA